MATNSDDSSFQHTLLALTIPVPTRSRDAFRGSSGVLITLVKWLGARADGRSSPHVAPAGGGNAESSTRFGAGPL